MASAIERPGGLCKQYEQVTDEVRLKRWGSMAGATVVAAIERPGRLCEQHESFADEVNLKHLGSMACATVVAAIEPRCFIFKPKFTYLQIA